MLTRATFTHPHPQIGAHTDSHLVVSLHGETEHGATARSPLSIVLVVDVSGSMGAARKLKLVTTALTHLSEHLAATDRLALVTFDSYVHTRVPLMRADIEGVGEFTRALGSLRPGGMTALAGGLSAGIAQARQAPGGDLARVIVLTDGQPNVGATDTDSLVGLARNRPEHVSISFLGVGDDCDHELLGVLAEHGGGSYGFIETATDAPGVLGAEIGGLLDAEAHNVKVTVTTKDRYCTLSASAPLGMTAENDGDAMVITVAQVLRGTTRNLVIPVELTGAGKNHARPVTCAVVTIEGTIDNSPIRVELRPKVKFSTNPGDVDESLMEKVELAQVAQAITDARARTSRGDYAGARDLFESMPLGTAGASMLRDSLAGSYASADTYAASASSLSSARAATAGSLSGSSAAFNTLASSAIGSVYSDGQRRLSVEATYRTSGSSNGTTASSKAAGSAEAPDAHEPGEPGEAAVAGGPLVEEDGQLRGGLNSLYSPVNPARAASGISSVQLTSRGSHGVQFSSANAYQAPTTSELDPDAVDTEAGDGDDDTSQHQVAELDAQQETNGRRGTEGTEGEVAK